MNWLFLVIAGVSVVGAFVTRRNLAASGATQAGPVPGYSSTDGRLLKINPTPDLRRDEDWWPVRLEEFHSQNRTRVVVELKVRPGLEIASVRQLVAATAQEIVALTHAHVVYTEAMGDGGLRAALMLSPDNRGWTGGDATREAWLVPEELS